MKDECVSLPKSKAQLVLLHDDDEDVFATSFIDRYAARPHMFKTCAWPNLLLLLMVPVTP